MINGGHLAGVLTALTSGLYFSEFDSDNDINETGRNVNKLN